MAITTTCPGCKALFRLPDELAGQSVRCQKCERMFVVPLPVTGQGMAMPSEPVTEAPEVIEEIIPVDEESPPVEPIIEAALAEPQEVKPSEPAAPRVDVPKPTAFAPERPPSRLWTAAAIGGFLLALVAAGAFAIFWIATHLAPPPRVVLVPPLKESPRGPFEHPVGVAPFERRIQATPLALDKGHSTQVNDRLAWPEPLVDHGIFGRNGPLRLYSIRLEQGKRYHFYVKANGFNPQIKIYRAANIQVGIREFSAENRLALTLEPNVNDDYTIWITSWPHQIGDFSLAVGVEQPAAAIQVELRKQSIANVNDTLRVTDPRDTVWNPTGGPYHEYRVQMQADTDYVFKINERNVNANFRPVLQVYEHLQNAWRSHPSEVPTLVYTFRARETREYRFRVTSAAYGEGAYTLSIERKPTGKQPERIIAPVDGADPYQATHQFTARDALEPSAPGRGPYKEYFVTLWKGQNYRIEMASTRFVPMLSLLDRQNKQAALKQAAGKASINYTPNETGTYRIRAIASRPTDRGEYTIKIAEMP